MEEQLAAVLDQAGLDRVVDALREDGRTVIGPVVRDDVITHDEITSTADLPRGWTEDQDGGRYRLEPTGTDELFAFSSPSSSWKRFVYPERTLLIRSTRRDGQVTVTQPEAKVPSMAFFGVRSCDLAALSVLDGVFGDSESPDPNYQAVRADVFIVAVGCGHPGNTCFCVSMDTGPSPRSGFDLAITELYDDVHHEFLVRAGTDRGQSLLGRVQARAATELDLDREAAVQQRSVAAMGRHLDPVHPPLAAANLDHPRWDDVADRCLACSNCTMVCPTCFCGATEDVTDLSGDQTERFRVWDSCFTLDFSHLPGGSVRTSTKSRYRQWLLHKLVTWHEQFGSSGCVGCGRCISWCPVGIDLTAEIAALAEAPAHEHETAR